jgi:hypothetical protein
MDDRSPGRRDAPADPADEARAAIGLAVAFLPSVAPDPSEYQLVAAESQVRGADPPRPDIWRLTFKRRALIPRTADAEIGAGGELFIEVDLASRGARLLGHGE